MSKFDEFSAVITTKEQADAPSSRSTGLRPITTKQFGWSSVFVTLSGIFCVLPGNIWDGFAPGCLTISMLITMPREELERPQTRRDLVVAIGIIAFLVAVVFFLSRVVSAEWGEPLLRALRHPLFIFPLTSVMFLIRYRQWQLGRQGVNAT